MRLALRTKVSLTVSILLVVIFAAIMYLTLSENVSQQQASLNQQSKSFAALATPPIGDTFLLYQDSGSIRITQQVDKYLALDPDVTSVRVVSVDGKTVYSSNGKPGAPVPVPLASSFQPQYVEAGGYIKRVVQPYLEDSGAHRYALVYDISTKRVANSVSEAVRQIVLIAIGILVVSIVASAWALNVIFIRPLRQVSRSANLISQGDLDRQIVLKNRDELGDLAASVNKMADSLKADIVKLRELDKLKTEFMMIASHNLRTPLTVMRGYIEMADQAESVKELRAIINTVQESVVRLHLLSEDLLTISNLESGDTVVKKTPTDDKTFIESVVEEFRLLAEKKGLHWEFKNTVPASAKSELNQANIRSALGNIIDNAIKFTKEGGAIRVAAAVREGQLVFSVYDNGIGIAPEEMPKLFTKFHRGTGTSKYDYEGVGIGLYLTKLLVEQHGGRVTADSRPGKGSAFTVYLPLSGTGP